MTSTQPEPRLPPLTAPFAADVAGQLEQMMPPGVPPIALFRQVAHNPRVLDRWRGGALLDKGSISLRQREIVILRVTARLGAEYEWGVHVAFFAAKAGFTAAELTATYQGGAADFAAADEALLLRMVDMLIGQKRLDDALWHEASAVFSPAQIVEILALAGFYHTVSFTVNTLRTPLEPGAPRFPQTAEVSGPQ
ncbi:carboxymuconolactone decarboxylase family protein [Ferrovibrio sp.]|uniref:carboxymuconolactone decarboxylase family protein n=1 Tax=Ferrovibrio sp. TaxID=1917215 RepID=UPI001B5B946E|nr:carboxymuconolactone decarboxylase family protein [Ferrovibrio sp.]MBP7064518.1 carboxymuconolactone decarboxylase family protein [Ferrovibrio sp.]